MKISFWFVLVMVLGAGLCARADILFLDLNGRYKEVEAAQAAAKARGEKLIVIPQISKSESLKYEQLFSKSGQLEVKWTNSKCGSDGSTKSCQELRKSIEQAKAAVEQLKNQKFLNEEKLKKGLSDLKGKGVQISSVVLSGHDGNGSFGGSFGDLSDQNLANAFNSNAPLGENVRSLALWGCYTANIGSLSQHWKQAFPNVEVVAGFDLKGPLGNSPSNWALLKDFLTKEKQLTALKDQKQVKEALKKLNGASNTNATICVNGIFANNRMAMNLSEAESLCNGAFLKNKLIYDCYLNAEKGCEDPPANTSTSDLRSFYESLQEYSHCEEILKNESGADFPSRDVLIRLIHFKEVKENFARNFQLQLSDYNRLLRKVNAPESLQWGNIEKMTRAEVIAKLKATSAFIHGHMNEDSAWAPEFQAISNTFSMGIQPGLGDLNVPFTWVEKGAQPSEAMNNAMSTVSATNVAKIRDTYESQRANRILGEKLESVLKDNSVTKADMAQIQAKEAEIKQQIENGANFRDVMKPAQDLEDQKRSLRIKYWNVLSADMQAYKNELQAQGYDSVEGKKIFDEKLNQAMAKFDSEAKK